MDNQRIEIGMNIRDIIDNVNTKNLYQAMRVLKCEHKLTYSYIGAMMGISYSSAYRLVKGDIKVMSEDMLNLAIFKLKISLNHLLATGNFNNN